jgi:hypothetical protein
MTPPRQRRLSEPDYSTANDAHGVPRIHIDVLRRKSLAIITTSSSRRGAQDQRYRCDRASADFPARQATCASPAPSSLAIPRVSAFAPESLRRPNRRDGALRIALFANASRDRRSAVPVLLSPSTLRGFDTRFEILTHRKRLVERRLRAVLIGLLITMRTPVTQEQNTASVFYSPYRRSARMHTVLMLTFRPCL